jgi:hypothetical protein
VGGLIIIRRGLPPVDRGDETAEKIAEPYADQQGDQRLPAHDVGERRSLFLGHSGASGGRLTRLAPGVARQCGTLLAERVHLLAQRAHSVLIRSVFSNHALATFDEACGCWRREGHSANAWVPLWITGTSHYQRVTLGATQVIPHAFGERALLKLILPR